MTRNATIVPSGCHWCGIGAREHMRRWTTEAGWHTWTPPTDAQIKARMKARNIAAIEETL